MNENKEVIFENTRFKGRIAALEQQLAFAKEEINRMWELLENHYVSNEIYTPMFGWKEKWEMDNVRVY